MIGSIISHYKILEKLGEGGMGVVYKAHDTKLDRVVALKFLPHHLMTDQTEQARFMQEARAAASLNHPNVCSIYSIDEFEGQQFIEMECVDGVTLREKISRGPLKPDDATAYAIQIGQALQEAHAKGIVHRDIKCDNIMVNSKNQIKVMDFGLAKLKGSLKLTRTSSTLGTLAYMAPEQLQGGDVDSRSDIFSFGVVFFEMLTGHLPFRGEHEAATMYSIVNEPPEPITVSIPDASSELVHIIPKALEKDPDDRYQSVADMVVDLRRLKKQSTKVVRDLPYEPPRETTKPVEPTPRHDASRGENASVPRRYPRIRGRYLIGSGALVAVIVAIVLVLPEKSEPLAADPGRKMIAVLPFENLGNAEQEYFADGLTEEITNRLSGLSGLGVIARSSAMQYKNSQKPLSQVGSELGVGYVLQGTVRWGSAGEGGNRVRVSPVLIKVGDGTQMWSQPYDAVFSDVFTIQTDIASQVAGAMGVTLLQPEKQSLEITHTANPEAYDAYLRGNDYYGRSYREQDFQIAQTMYEKATELDDRFALAFARLSEVHSAMYWHHYDHTTERLNKAKKAIDHALRLDPNLSEVHAALGYYHYWGFLDYENALKEMAIAQRSRPNDSRLMLGIAAVQRRQGKMELAAETMRKATELDPRSSELAFNTAETYTLLRRYDESLKFIDRVISLAPDWAEIYSHKTTMSIAWTGDTRIARKTMEPVLLIAGSREDQFTIRTLALVEVIDGNYEKALRIFADGPSNPTDTQFEYIPHAQHLAEIHGFLRDQVREKACYDSARVQLESAIRRQPDDARFHSSLGISLAGLGRKSDAIREAMRGVELMPISMEAWRGTYRVRDLARTYMMVGEYDSATARLGVLLTRPSDISKTFLRVHPTWAPLRNHEGFRKLISETP